eukprot:jgi/Chrzof1/12784/Cz07g07140.t1
MMAPDDEHSSQEDMQDVLDHPAGQQPPHMSEREFDDVMQALMQHYQTQSRHQAQHSHNGQQPHPDDPFSLLDSDSFDPHPDFDYDYDPEDDYPSDEDGFDDEAFDYDHPRLDHMLHGAHAPQQTASGIVSAAGAINQPNGRDPQPGEDSEAATSAAVTGMQAAASANIDHGSPHERHAPSPSSLEAAAADKGGYYMYSQAGPNPSHQPVNDLHGEGGYFMSPPEFGDDDGFMTHLMPEPLEPIFDPPEPDMDELLWDNDYTYDYDYD